MDYKYMSKPQRSYPPLGEIKIGEPDANSEYFSALRTNSTPIFLDCFLSMPQFSIEEFKSGEKYLLYGQKGTGKTSVLRYLQRDSINNKYISEFIIFKKAFLEEMDINEYAKIPLMVDEDSLKRYKHFHHTIKRLTILLLLKLTFSSFPEETTEYDTSDRETQSLIQKIANSTIGDVIKLGMDSISTIFNSVNIDIQKETNGHLLIEGGRLLKRNNDDLLAYAVRRMKKIGRPIRLYIDEIHFAYRSEESLQQDAILVRDTILAVQNLNDRFSEENIDAIIYMAVRAEYLEHPIIATADINHSIESVGHELTWSNFPLNKNHPLFELVFLRFKKSISQEFKKEDFFKVYLGSIDPVVFLERTWSKPRDFVRFFKCARKLYPNLTYLNVTQSNAVWRNYSQEAWKEIKSSASPFLPPKALSLFEETLSAASPDVFDGTKKYNIASFGKLLEPVYLAAKENQVNFYSFDHFIRLLYILGIFLTKRSDANYQEIYHSYHRGNRNYHANGDVLIHPTVLKAFG